MRVVLVSGGVISGVGKGEFFPPPLSFVSIVGGGGRLRCTLPREHKASRSCPSMKYIFYLAPRRDAIAPRLAWQNMTGPSDAQQNELMADMYFCFAR